MSKDTYYCPKCGKKKLKAESSYRSDYNRIWKCWHNVPPTRRRYGSTPKKLGPPCGLIIKVEDRDAEIDDYDDVLGKLAMIDVPQIQQYLLKEDRDVHKRGIEVIYEGTMVDLVRRRDSGGVGVALYWKAATYEQEVPDVINPFSSAYGALRSEAANHVMFRGRGVGHLFHNNGYEIWDKDNESLPFTGKDVGKRMRADMVSWADALEKGFDLLATRCKNEAWRWDEEQRRFEQTLRNTLPSTDQHLVRLQHYSGASQTAKLAVAAVTARQALEISKLLDRPVELQVLSQGPPVSPEKAIEIQSLVSQTMTFDLNRDHFQASYGKTLHRFTIDEAVALARIMGRR